MSLVVMQEEALEALLGKVVDERLAEFLGKGSKPEPDLVDADTLCQRLSISRSTLNRFRSEGMPKVPAGTVFRYSPSECLAWLKNRPVTERPKGHAGPGRPRKKSKEPRSE